MNEAQNKQLLQVTASPWYKSYLDTVQHLSALVYNRKSKSILSEVNECTS